MSGLIRPGACSRGERAEGSLVLLEGPEGVLGVDGEVVVERRRQCPSREIRNAWWSRRVGTLRFLGLQLSQPHLIDRIIFALAQDEPGTGASGQNIVAQIDHVNPLPNPLRGPGGLRIGEPAIAMEIRTRILKRCAGQVEKALDIPLADD